MKATPLAVPFIIVMLAAASAFGEGTIPVDLKTRTVTTDHILLEVSDTQAEEMDTQGTLTFTKEQWQLLRQKGLMWPMRLEWIVDYNEDTCACALMGYTGIRLDEKRVAILTGGSDIENAREVLIAAGQGAGSGISMSLKADRKGQFYAKGVLIPYRDLLAYFQEQVHSAGKKRQLSLNINFPVDIDRHSTTVKERVDQLEASAKSSGWEVHVEEKVGEPDSDT